MKTRLWNGPWVRLFMTSFRYAWSDFKLIRQFDMTSRQIATTHKARCSGITKYLQKWLTHNQSHGCLSKSIHPWNIHTKVFPPKFHPVAPFTTIFNRVEPKIMSCFALSYLSLSYMSTHSPYLLSTQTHGCTWAPGHDLERLNSVVECTY